MSQAFEYPTSRFEPSPLVDLSEPGVRARLGPGALRAFLNIMREWKIRDEDSRRLLDGVSSGTFYAMKRDPNRAVAQDSLTRISYLVGIYKALHILYGDELADRWPSLPNTNVIFGGSRPIDFMMRGGLPAFQTVRRVLDARRGGS